ncbi:MAG: molybdenum ABC transporter ATP-binding protein [Sphingomonadales bacterium]
MIAGVDAIFRLALGDFVLDARLTLPATGVSALFGPSGSGKTTLLRCLAGLEPSVKGRLTVNGQPWQSDATFLAPEQRALGVVFQDTRMFAHLTVEQNLRYGFKRTPAERRRISIDEVIQMLGIGGLLDRRPHLLSGGERQRVAIGRALLTSPALLLLDEPMGALDSARKKEIFPFLDRLHRELDIPIIYVSHDLNEITRLADTLATMDNGQVIECGPIAQTLSKLNVMEQARAMAVTVQAHVDNYDAAFGAVALTLPGGVPVSVAGPPLARGDQVSLRIAASQIELSTRRPANVGFGTIIEATVQSIPETNEPLFAVPIRIGTSSLLSTVNRRLATDLELTAGQRLFAVIRHAEVIGQNHRQALAS